MLKNPKIQIRQLTQSTNVSSFDCGIPELNDFLQRDAYKNQTEWLSVTKVMYLDDKLVGYFTITPDTLHKGRIDISDKLNDYPYQKYPAVKLARLAVDYRYQHRGLGKALMREFFYTAHQIAKIEGSRFITVDAKTEAKTFYQMYLFVPVISGTDSEIIPMYLDFKRFYDKTLSEIDE